MPEEPFRARENTAFMQKPYKKLPRKCDTIALNNILPAMKKYLLSHRPLNNDFGLFLLRVSFGSLMLLGHGWPKLATFGEKADSFANVMGMGPTVSLALAVLTEFFCSALLVLGLFTRLALIPLMITMAVIVLVIHAEDPFARQEFPLLYFLGFFTLFLTGPGKYSLDRLFKLS